MFFIYKTQSAIFINFADLLGKYLRNLMRFVVFFLVIFSFDVDDAQVPCFVNNLLNAISFTHAKSTGKILPDAKFSITLTMQVAPFLCITLEEDFQTKKCSWLDKKDFSSAIYYVSDEFFNLKKSNLLYQALAWISHLYLFVWSWFLGHLLEILLCFVFLCCSPFGILFFCLSKSWTHTPVSQIIQIKKV